MTTPHFSTIWPFTWIKAILFAGPVDFERRVWLFQAQGLAKAAERGSFYLYVPEQDVIYLVMIYGKSQKKDLTQEEKNALRKAADKIRNSGHAR